ncbi:hypothetical protein HS088_TW09G00927 [Tripterygium wilfordii]|uniref:Transmembrane protein n=1 Tax=Tripterygium wilfordii TaxID=458696 RepID=A0A7J7D9V9_TRIWF|nr:hypothetical protein HS088_TW09G00927 [Tripterygium wilfordii]
MSERDSIGLPQEKERPSSTKSSSSSSCLHILLDSIKIISRNKQIFFPIFALLALPLSLHLFSVSFVSLPLKSHIHHLESVALYSASRFEARQIWKESRESAISLLRLKALFFLPSFILSLLAAISSVSSTAAAGITSQRPNLRSALTAIRQTWHRPALTTIFIYAVSLSYFNVPRVLAVVIGGGSHLLRFLIWVILSGLDVYLMAVMGMGLVVSITEERFGWEAIRVGSGLMEGRRLCGWMLSGLMVLISGVIGWKMERFLIMAIDRQDPSNWWTSVKVVVGGSDRFVLVCLYGFVVVWSYAIATVYYCECRKRHVVRVEDNGVEELVPV